MRTRSRRNAYGVTKIVRDSYSSTWWDNRKKVFARDSGKCQGYIGGIKCSRKGSEVHHIIPLSRGGTNSVMNLITLCRNCHDARHNHLFR